jgi:hypothetical protein
LCSLATATLFAQSGKDCVTAASICGSATVPAPTEGIGLVTDAVPNACSNGTESGTSWNNTTWVTFVVTTAGTLTMNFDANPDADIDFALWKAPAGTTLATACASLASYNTRTAAGNHRCDYNSSSTASGFGSPTCPTGNAGCDAAGAMTVAVGDRIVAVVSDFSTFNNLGFTPTLAGTSARACPAPCNSTAAATCTVSSIYATVATALAGIDGCNVDEVRSGLVAGTQVQQFCNTFTTPASLTNSTIGMEGTVARIPGTAGNISFTSETFYTNAGVVIPSTFTSGGYPYWTIAPSTTYKYCWTFTGNGTVTQMQSPCFRPFYAACNMSAVTVANKSACNGNSTVLSTDDYYTADVTVTYTGVPGTGTLGLSGSQIHTAVTAVAVGSVGATSYTFTGVRIKANGSASTITAAFSADALCTATSASQAAVASCSCAASATLGLGVTTP